MSDYVGREAMTCHASTAVDGVQVQCSEKARADCPARDEAGQMRFRLPLCFRHAFELLKFQAEERAT